VDLMVLLAIVVLLALLLFPALQYVRESSNQIKCSGNIRGITLACLSCNDALGSMPPYHVGPGVELDPKSSFATPGNHGSFFYFVMPFIEQNFVFNLGCVPRPNGKNCYSVQVTYGPAPPPPPPPTFVKGIPYISTGVVTDPPTPPFLGQIPVKFYQCPSDPTMPLDGVQQTAQWGACSYACNYLVFGNPNADVNTSPSIANPDGYDAKANPPHIAPAALPKIPGSFPDGTSTTLLLAEKYSTCQWLQGGMTIEPQPGGNLWAWPGNNASYAPAFAMEWPWNCYGATFQLLPAPTDCNVVYPSTGHTGYMNVGMADGSARTISPNISALTWHALCTPNGGDKVGPDF
jgi:prepilin-type processing-associated H-X9-DG protein